MNDMSKTIVPDSTQINADELQAGPVTVKITGVKIKGGKEQPVDMILEGMEKVYRPCKSMCRIIVAAWGADAAKYVGRSLTLYCDPTVRWGGLAVGGLRISHMSDIDSAMTMALTVTRANKKPFTVKPLKAASGAAAPKAAASPSEQSVQAPTGGQPQEAGAVAAPMTDDAIAKEIGKLVKSQEYDLALDLAGKIVDEARRLVAKERICKERDKGAV